MTTNTVSIPQQMKRQLKLMRAGFQFLGAITPNIAGTLAANLMLRPQKRPYSTHSQRVMSKAQQKFVCHGSRQLTTFTWENDGPTVLLVHGWGSNCNGMSGLVQPLLDEGFRVVTFDAPAHGRSDGKQTNVVDFSGAIQTVIKNSGPVDHIVAHSFGAATTLFTLVREPNLGIKRVVSIGAPSRLGDMLNIWSNFLGLTQATDKQLRRKVIDLVGLPIEELAVDKLVSQLTLPGLIIHDKDDSIASYANAEAINQQWSSATLYSTTGLDHRGTLHNKDVFQQVTQFLIN